MKKQRTKSNNLKKGIIIGLSIFTFVYLVPSIFFMNHFYFGSKINGIDVSFKTVEQAKDKISSVISTYSLEISGRDGVKGKIDGKEVGLKYNQNDKIKEFKDNQNPFSWIASIFRKSQIETTAIMTFDKKLLDEKLNKENFFSSKKLVEPKNVSFEYAKEGYKVISEVNGNKIKKDTVYESIKNAILNQKPTLNLDEANCYEKPKYTTKSKEVEQTKKLLNKYTSFKITYKFGEDKEVIDGSTINKWLYTDENLDVAFNKEQMEDYVNSLSIKYNTYGRTRDFETSSGKTVQVHGGDYGWVINKSQEIKKLIDIIKDGKDVEREPVYSQKAIQHGKDDIGKTYVEINLTMQHLWFYKNGALVTEGDVVTGDTSKNLGTPSGTYMLNYKEKHATLKGENYSTPVDFWMPFNGNIGIHDAIWRNDFGKNIYTTNGSHGCINSPYSLANAIYENIEAGTPIICYTE